MRRYENAFLWLTDAIVVNVAYNSTSPDIGLGMNLDSSSFKCYSLDTGLLVSQSMSGRMDADAKLEVDDVGVTYLPFYMAHCL